MRPLLAQTLVPAAFAIVASLPAPASAAEVVWLTPPTDEDAVRVAVQAGARRGPLTPARFRASLVERRPTDDSAVDVVAETLEKVRVHERVLDGELLILGGLETPLEQVRLLRDTQDREIVVRALLYQGFAVDRYWGDTLATAPEAVTWRLFLDDSAVERPWLDAFGLDPLRRATDADISEAPQRDAYDALRRLLARAPRAQIVTGDLPDGAELVLDGEIQALDGPGVLDVLPGRHWIHVQLDGEIIGLQVARLEPAQRFEVSLPVPESDWQLLRRTLHGGGDVVPDSVRDGLERFGGEVWFAEGRGEQLRVWAVTPRRVRRVELVQTIGSTESSGAIGNVSVSAWLGPSFLHSADFRSQDPDAVPDGAGVVNSLAPHGGVELAWDRDWLRYGVGLDLTLPLGEHHVALSGEGGSLRARPYPHVIVGHPVVQGTFGLLFPYHLVGGVQTTVPLPGMELLEARGFLRIGGAPALTRTDGTVWKGKPVVQLGVGVGGRLRP